MDAYSDNAVSSVDLTVLSASNTVTEGRVFYTLLSTMNMLVTHCSGNVSECIKY